MNDKSKPAFAEDDKFTPDSQITNFHRALRNIQICSSNTVP
jgi:hypothetical protein